MTTLTHNPRVLATIIRRPSGESIGGGAIAGRSLSRYVAKHIPIDCAEMADHDEVIPWEGNSYYHCRGYYGIPEPMRRVAPFLQARELNAFMFSRIPTLIQQSTYSVVHIHNLHPIWAVYQVAKSCQKAGVPYITACHGVHEMAATGRMKNGKYGGPKALAAYLGTQMPLRYVFQHSSLIYASSPADNPVLEALGARLTRVRVVPNGVAPEILQKMPEAAIENLRTKYQLPNNVPLLVFVGHLRPKKGVDDLIKAVAQIAFPWHLVIVGPHSFPELARQLQNLAQETGQAHRITFTGEVPLEDLPGFYQLADIFTFPSRQETLPLAVLEAMSKAKPTVAARVGGVPYQVGEDAGILYEPGDVDGLSAAIQTLLAQPQMRQEMGKAAYVRLIKEFTWEEAAQRAIAGYQELTDVRTSFNGRRKPANATA